MFISSSNLSAREKRGSGKWKMLNIKAKGPDVGDGLYKAEEFTKEILAGERNKEMFSQQKVF